MKKKLTKLIADTGLTKFPCNLAEYLLENDVIVQSEGEWIKRTPCSEAECNQCGRCPKLVFGMLPNYCPNCGAKMKSTIALIVKRR